MPPLPVEGDVVPDSDRDLRRPRQSCSLGGGLPSSSGDHEPCRPLLPGPDYGWRVISTPGTYTIRVDRRAYWRPIAQTPSTMVV
jgi:hypothetical protein